MISPCIKKTQRYGALEGCLRPVPVGQVTALGASRVGTNLWLLSRRRGSCAVVLDPLGCNPLGALLGCLRSFLLLGSLVRVHSLVGAVLL